MVILLRKGVRARSLEETIIHICNIYIYIHSTYIHMCVYKYKYTHGLFGKATGLFFATPSNITQDPKNPMQTAEAERI